MEANPLLAYVTSTEDRQAISFGRNYQEARRLGALELGLDCDEVDSCERASQYDSYAPGPVPVQDLIELFGWHYACWGCGCEVSADTEVENEDTGEVTMLSPVYGPSHVYCSTECEEIDRSEKQRLRALKADMKAALLAKFPGVTAGLACVHNKPPRIYFTFPGGRHEGSWEMGSDNVLIPKLDVPAWRAFRVQPA